MHLTKVQDNNSATVRSNSFAHIVYTSLHCLHKLESNQATRNLSSMTAINFTIPEAIIDFASTYVPTQDVAERMRFVIKASHLNIEQGFGGPFAAGVFDCASGELIALGTNLVLRENLSMLHAEMVTLALAERKLGTFDLSSVNGKTFEIATSCEPCAMCLGAIHWSGINRVIAAARDADAAEVGFDEGPKPARWDLELQARNVEVICDLERDAARDVMKAFQAAGGKDYHEMINHPDCCERHKN